MTSRRHLLFAPLAAALLAAAPAQAQVPGQPAPAFTLNDTAGKAVSLADFKGRWVVLEWVNPHCPFVVKHYGSQNMQALQKRAAGDKVAWLAINSTADTHSEFEPPAKLAAWMNAQGAAPTATLLDPEGTVGKAFKARTTPHMFVIDPAGTIVYAGAIDDKRSANPADIKTATNHVAVALAEGKAGKPLSLASTTPYGCSVKYK